MLVSALPSFRRRSAAANLLLLLLGVGTVVVPIAVVDAFSPSSQSAFVSSWTTTTGFNRPATTTATRSSSRLGMVATPTTTVAVELEDDDDTSEAAGQNIFGRLSDAVTGAAFSLLHAFDDDCGIEDSSKNLRVLWVRALLNQQGRIDDPVAETFLPPSTRGLVTSDAGASLLEPVLRFTEWIQARTDFIDEALDNFLSSPACTDPDTGRALDCNVVLCGAGYDTRALRYRHKHEDNDDAATTGKKNRAHFIEVDLPAVVAGKRKLYEKFQREQDPDWDFAGQGSSLVGFDLNGSGGDDPVSLIELLREEGGLRRDVPTFVVFEAVLFYVNEDAVRNIMRDLFDFAAVGGNGSADGAETMLCFTDSLKPFVDVPFTNEAQKFFDGEADMDLLQHRSRWGGAVHFALAASRREKEEAAVAATTVVGASAASAHSSAATAATHQHTSSRSKNDKVECSGKIAKHVSARVGGIVHSYTPTQANNKAILKTPSFDNVWYAVGYPWQIDGYDTPLDAVLERKSKSTKPFATRLWGEPLIIYRDTNDELVAMADVCPHRSVPLSMGKYENGKVRCMYHGWTFGGGGECVDIPTLRTGAEADNKEKDKKIRKKVTESNCGNVRGVVEHEGLVYVWRGNVLEADVSLLPSRRLGDMETVPIDTVLDYNVDYSYIVENNLDSPHLFYLHDGSVPPIESIGMLNKNLPMLRLKAFTDDCGMGHLGRFGDAGRPKKLIRFDPPNIVRHGGVSGFEEEFHIIPVAPQRTRVLLRQHLPRGPILSTVTSFPFVLPILTVLVNNWNYHIALEDSCVMQGQASRIEDWGSPRMGVGGLGDDLIKRFWNWRSKAHKALAEKAAKDGSSTSTSEGEVQKMITPYFVDFARTDQGSSFDRGLNGIRSGTSFGDDPSVVSKVRADSRLRNIPLVTDDQEVDASTGNPIGSWGIKQTYLQATPAANFPPINYKQYKNMLVFDQFVKNILEENGEDCPVDVNDRPRNPPSDDSNRSSRTGKKHDVPLSREQQPEVQPVYAATLTSADQTAVGAS